MNYELAKELKDAGFPQEGKGARIAPPDKIVARREDFAYVPALEELIEACGKNFMRLETVAANGWWEAHGRFWNTDGSLYFRDPSLGDTPAEAVAHLWLAVNSKRYAGHEAHEEKS
jgi:hypothetical protein